MAIDNETKVAVASLMTDKNKRSEFAEMITEFVQPNHITENYVGMLLNTRTLQPGDSLVKKLRKGLKVRTLVPGSVHLKGEITISDRVNYVLDGAHVGVNASEWELEKGEIGTVEEIRREMSAKLADYYQGKVFTALSTVWTATNTPNNFIDLGGAVTSAALEDAIDYINQQTSGVKAVVGTKAAMAPITKFGAFWSDGTNVGKIDSQLEEIVQRGFLGKYYGANLVHLPQIFDDPQSHTGLLPDDKIIVIGENVGEFINYGPARSKEYTDPRPTPPMWVYELYQQFGLMLWRSEGIYVIKVA